MPHYYFDLTDGFTRKDRSGLDCADDAAAIVKGKLISLEVASGSLSLTGLKMHISVVNDFEREVSQIPIIWPLPIVPA
jgi:hypothetical protein